jgi:hypothetical protein
MIMLAVGAAVLATLAGWAAGRGAGLRNLIAFFLAALSSYSAGFLLDIWVQGFAGYIPKANLMAPTFTWFWIAVASLVCSFNAAGSPYALSIPFLLNAAAALVAATFHTRHIYVAVPLAFIGALVLVTRRRQLATGSHSQGSRGLFLR